MLLRTISTVLYTLTIALPALATDTDMLSAILSLEEAQKIAIADNPNLKAAESRVAQARAVLVQARSAYYPSVTTSLTASVTEISDDDFESAEAVAMLSGGSADDTFESYNGNVTIGYLVFDGFGRKFRTAAAELGSQRNAAALLESKRLLLNAVALAYYNVQLARESVTIAEADKAFNTRQLREADVRLKAGAGSLSDKLNFEVRLRAAQSGLLQSNRNKKIALIGLTRLMGVTRSRIPESLDVARLKDESNADMQLPEEEASIAYSLGHRPDLKEVEHVVAQTDALAKASRSSYFPTATASASVDSSRGDNVFFEEDNTSSTLALRLQYDIFVGGRRKAIVHESEAINKEFERVFDGQVIAVTSEVREALATLGTAQDLLVLQEETTNLVEENRMLVEKEYNAGQGSLVRLNQAQRDLISQQASYALARVSLRQSWINLHTATGAILD